MYVPVFFFINLILIFFPSDSSLSETEYIAQLIEKANALSLHKHEAWRALVHYKDTLWGTQSLIDDPKFFLAEDGRKNPKAELHATIRAFFLSASDEKKHPLCRFIARYHWLKEMLQIDDKKIPFGGCSHIEEFINKIAPKSATLVFPASNINSPASMFGHTLISIETANRSKLLAHAIDYSAHTLESWMVMLAFRGIFGFYKGYFNILPYYAKVQEYNDFDQRDIWEYRLNFTEEEVRKMIYHIIELENVYSHYYFFDENCSYNILFLLDVARPSLKLTDRFYTKIPTWVIPVDTIRAIQEAGLVEETEFRPSRVTKIRHLSKALNKEGTALAKDILAKKKSPQEITSASLSEDEKACVADLLTEYIRYQYSQQKISKEEYSTRLIDMLNARSAIQTSHCSTEIPTPPCPECGHRAARAYVGTGFSKSMYQEFRIRPAYHTIIDRDDGYIEGGHIVFGDLALRFYDDEKKLLIQRWDIIDLISLTPNDDFIRAVSWKVTTGFRRIFFDDAHMPLVAFMNPGRGFAWNLLGGITYILGEMDFGVGKNIENKYFIAGGISCGMLISFTPYIKIHVAWRDLLHILPLLYHEGTMICALNIALSQNTSIRMDFQYDVHAPFRFDSTITHIDTSIGANLYF